MSISKWIAVDHNNNKKAEDSDMECICTLWHCHDFKKGSPSLPKWINVQKSLKQTQNNVSKLQI